jgi:hypothetical protein
MSVLCLSFLSNSYFFVCYFIHYDKSNIFTPVFKTASSSIATCYKTCKFKEYNDYLITFMFLLYFNSSDLPELRVHYSCRIIGGTHSTCRCWMIYSFFLLKNDILFLVYNEQLSSLCFSCKTVSEDCSN